MAFRNIGIWMYQNCGGKAIEQKILEGLREREINAVTNLDLAEATSFDGQILCNGIIMNQLDLFFSYNAGQQTNYQQYLYQSLSESIPTINNYHAFALTEDKFRTAHLLRRHNVSTTDHVLCNRKNIPMLKQKLQSWEGKAICKPVDGWGGRGLIKLESERDFDLLTPYLLKQDAPQFYIERVIENDFSDYRIDIVNGQVVSCYGRQAAKGEWKTNITNGGNIMLREPNDEVIALAINAAKVTGLEIAGVDIIYDLEHEKYVVIEVNGIPAFATPEQEILGLNFNQHKIDKIVELIDITTAKPSLNNILDAININSNVANTQLNTELNYVTA